MSLNRDICKKMTDVKCCVFKVSDYIFLPPAPKMYNNVVKKYEFDDSWNYEQRIIIFVDFIDV